VTAIVALLVGFVTFAIALPLGILEIEDPKAAVYTAAVLAAASSAAVFIVMTGIPHAPANAFIHI
jgi:hypothetical protein